MKKRKDYIWDSERGVYYDKSQFGEIGSTPVYEEKIFPPNKGIWNCLQWPLVWDLWSLIGVRKLLCEMFWNHIKHFACIIFSIILFTGVLMIQKPVMERDILVPVNKTIDILPTYQAQNSSWNNTVQEEITVNIHNRSEKNQYNANEKTSLLLKDIKVAENVVENGPCLTEASVRRIIQDEFVKYDLKRTEKSTSVIPENTLRKMILNELMKYAADRMTSLASVMKIFEKSTKKMISDELAKYDADKLGIPDYALESAGGRIISASDTDGFGTGQYLQILGFNVWKVINGSPRNLIQPVVHPGNCWAFRGSQANVVIQLVRPIHVTAVTLEHIPVSISLSGNISSAPREFSVIGIEDTDKHIHLGAFTYMKEGPSRQYFTTTEKIGSWHIFKAVELWILSNHGNPEFTCVYRFRVHGQLPQ